MLQLENEPKMHKNLNSNFNVSKPSDLRGRLVYPGSKYMFTVQICTFLLGLDLLLHFCSDILEYCGIQ